MPKYKIIFLIIFIGAFLIAPIYVSTYVGGIELGIEYDRKFFGGFMLLYYTFYNLFGSFVSPSGYPSYFGELHFLSNFILLLFIALLCARLLTFLFVRIYQPIAITVFWSTSYLKKLVKHIITTTVIGIVIFFLISFILSSTGFINWLYNHTDIRSTAEVALPITLLGSFITLITLSFREKTLSTKSQKFLLLIESIIFVLGTVGLSIAMLYSFLG